MTSVPSKKNSYSNKHSMCLSKDQKYDAKSARKSKHRSSAKLEKSLLSKNIQKESSHLQNVLQIYREKLLKENESYEENLPFRKSDADKSLDLISILNRKYNKNSISSQGSKNRDLEIKRDSNSKEKKKLSIFSVKKYKTLQNIPNLAKSRPKEVTQVRVSDKLHDSGICSLFEEDNQEDRKQSDFWQNTSPFKKDGKTIVQSCEFGDNRGLNKFLNVYDSCVDEKDIFLSKNIKKNKFSIERDGRFRKSWDNLCFILVLYSTILFPYFLYSQKDLNSTSIYTISIIIEIIFLIDFFLNFYTSFNDSEGNKIFKKRFLIYNYIINWAFTDLVSCFPFYIFNFMITGKITGFSTSRSINFFTLRWLGVLKFMKFLKYSSTGRLLSLFDFTKNFSMNRIMKFIFVFMIIIHICSCMWASIGLYNQEMNFPSWIIEFDFVDHDYFDIYLASLYFNFVTLFTIGYGDILAISLNERVYNVIYMSVGTLVFSFVLSILSNLFTFKTHDSIILEEKIQFLDDLEYKHAIPKALYNKIRKNIEKQSFSEKKDRHYLLESLPVNLRNEVSLLIYKNYIQNIEFFKNQSNEFIMYTLPYFRSFTINKGETLFSIGECIDEMYVVISGRLSLSFRIGINQEMLEVTEITQNSHFGDLLIQTGEPSPYYLKCKSRFAEILLLKKEVFINLKALFPQSINLILKNSFKKLEIITQRNNLVTKLYSYDNSVINVKKRMNGLNSHLMEIGFDNYFQRGIDFQDPNEFLMKNDKNIFDMLLKQNYSDKQSIGKEKDENFTLKNTKELISLNSERKNSFYIKSTEERKPTVKFSNSLNKNNQDLQIKDSPIKTASPFKNNTNQTKSLFVSPIKFGSCKNLEEKNYAEITTLQQGKPHRGSVLMNSRIKQIDFYPEKEDYVRVHKVSHRINRKLFTNDLNGFGRKSNNLKSGVAKSGTLEKILRDLNLDQKSHLQEESEMNQKITNLLSREKSNKNINFNELLVSHSVSPNRKRKFKITFSKNTCFSLLSDPKYIKFSTESQSFSLLQSTEFRSHLKIIPNNEIYLSQIIENNIIFAQKSVNIYNNDSSLLLGFENKSKKTDLKNCSNKSIDILNKNHNNFLKPIQNKNIQSIQKLSKLVKDLKGCMN